MLFTEVVHMSARSNMTTQWLCCALVAIGVIASAARLATAQPLPCCYEVAAVIEAPTCGLGGVTTSATAINPSGTTVVGDRFCLGVAMPWKWTRQTGLVMLPLPPWLVEATPTDVNDNNIMVGTGEHSTVGVGRRGFLCDLNSMTWTELLPQNPPTGWSDALAINNDNVVVGQRSIDDGGDPVNPRTAFRWSGGTFTDLGLIDGFSTSGVDINESGDVSVSTGLLAPGFYARIWTGTAIVNVGPVPRGISSDAGRLGNNGELLTSGIIQQSPLVTRAFVFSPKTAGFQHLPRLPNATGGGGRRMADDGTIVGSNSFPGAGSPRRACIWIDYQVIDVNSLVDGSQFLAEQGVGITNSGTLLCNSSSAALLLEPIWRITGDTNCDEQVDIDDLINVILSWGSCAGCASDLTGDGTVDVDDLIEVIVNWSS
jgi:uncharacterized membrane protein